MLTSRSAKLTGTPGVGGWAQVHEFTPEDPEKLLARGHLYAIVATTRMEVTPGSFDTVSLGRELIARLHEEYFGDLTKKPFNALTQAVQKVIGEFQSSWGDVEIVASAVVGGIVYSVAGEGGKVLICRDGAVGTVLSGSGEVVSSSGFPKKGDILLMATKSFFENISQGVIKAALTSGDPEAAIETFAPAVHSTGDLGNLGVAIIKFEEKGFFAAPQTTEGETKLSDQKVKLAGLKIKAAGFLNKIAAKLPKKDVYVGNPLNDEVVSQSKKLTFSVALILLFILLVSIGFGIKQKKSNDLRNKYAGLLKEASDGVDQAVSLASVSPERSRELFYDAEQKLKTIKDLNIKDSQFDNLKKKIDESRAAILGEYLVTPDMFWDLSILASGFKGDVVTASGGNIYILDKSGKRVVSVAFETKKSKVVANQTQINEAFDMATYEGRTFILMSDGVYEVGSGKNKVVDKTWSGEAFIKSFAGNIYVLDKNGNAVYRYQGQGSAFGDRGNWLAAGTKTDFSDALGWVIDGSVYVLYPSSKILKYSLGSPQSFSLAGILPEISKIDAVYGDADNANIYILDTAGKRVVVIDKKGKYVAQYINDQIGQASNLVVSEADKKIILLIGDKLYTFDVKHLQ